MTAKTPRPPVQGAVEVGGVASQKRCSSSPTAKKSVGQAKSAKRDAERGPAGHGYLPKSDQGTHRDGALPYSPTRLARWTSSSAPPWPERAGTPWPGHILGGGASHEQANARLCFRRPQMSRDDLVAWGQGLRGFRGRRARPWAFPNSGGCS